MFTKRDIYLSLDISEILAIVNLNLAQNHSTKCSFVTGYLQNNSSFSKFSTIK